MYMANSKIHHARFGFIKEEDNLEISMRYWLRLQRVTKINWEINISSQSYDEMKYIEIFGGMCLGKLITFSKKNNKYTFSFDVLISTNFIIN